MQGGQRKIWVDRIGRNHRLPVMVLHSLGVFILVAEVIMNLLRPDQQYHIEFGDEYESYKRIRTYYSSHHSRDLTGVLIRKRYGPYCLFLLCVCFIANIPMCRTELLTLGEFSSNKEPSAKVCLMRLGISELSSPREKSFPKITFNETRWNAARHAEIDNMSLQSYAGGSSTNFILDGTRHTIRGMGTLVDPEGPIKMVTRRNLEEAVGAFGFKTMSERIAKSKEPLEKFIRIFHKEAGRADYDEKVGFIMSLGLSTRFSEYNVRCVRVLETCETSYIETAISYIGSLETDQVKIIEHRVNVIFGALNFEFNPHGGQSVVPWSRESKNHLLRYSVIWEASDSDLRNSEKKTRVTYDVAKNLRFSTPYETTTVGLYFTSYIKNSKYPGNTFVLWDSTKINSSSFPQEKLYRVEIGRGQKFTVKSGHPDKATYMRLLNARKFESDIISNAALSGARGEARKALEKAVSELDENNDILELVLACTALMTAIITVVCFGTSRFQILLRMCLEVMDLVIGAFPGVVVFRRGLFRGNLRVGPATFITKIVPTQLVKKRVINQTKEGKAVDVAYFPVLVTECTAVAFRKSPDRVWFIAAYSLGISVGVLILVFQLWSYLGARRRKEALVHAAEDPELSGLSENRAAEVHKPFFGSLLILRRRCRSLKKLRVLPREKRANQSVTDC